MTPARRAALLKLAIARNDRLAIATLTADRDYRPEPDTYLVFVGLGPVAKVAA